MVMPLAVSAGSDWSGEMTHAAASSGFGLKVIVAFPPAVFASVIASRSEQSLSQAPSFVSATFVTTNGPAARAAVGGFCASVNEAHSSTRTSDHATERRLRFMKALLSPDRSTTKARLNA